MASPSRRRTRAHSAWNVPASTSLPASPVRWAIRSRSSPAARLVNVTARIRCGRTALTPMRYAIRWATTRVLPDPAPARMSSGPSVVATARACSGFIRDEDLLGAGLAARLDRLGDVLGRDRRPGVGGGRSTGARAATRARRGPAPGRRGRPPPGRRAAPRRPDRGRATCPVPAAPPCACGGASRGGREGWDSPGHSRLRGVSGRPPGRPQEPADGSSMVIAGSSHWLASSARWRSTVPSSLTASTRRCAGRSVCVSVSSVTRRPHVRHASPPGRSAASRGG